MKKLFTTISVLLVINAALGQQNSEFCGLEYGGTVLSESKQLTDSLLSNGVNRIINFNHYNARSLGGYSKIIWKENNSLKGILIELNQINKDSLIINRSEIAITDIPFSNAFLNTDLQFAQDELKDMCKGWSSHQPHFLLQIIDNEKQNCLSIAQSDIDCNMEDERIKIIKELKIDFKSFLKLTLNQKDFLEIQNLFLDKKN